MESNLSATAANEKPRSEERGRSRRRRTEGCDAGVVVDTRAHTHTRTHTQTRRPGWNERDDQGGQGGTLARQEQEGEV